jgi:MscS family membrane protein
MRSFLHKVVLDNRLEDYLIFLIVIGLILVFKRFLSKILANLFFRLIKRTSWNVDRKAFVQLLAGPIHLFVMILMVFIAFEQLRFPSAFKFSILHVPFKDILESAAAAVVVICFTWLLLRCIDFLATILEQKANLTPGLSDDQLVVFFKDFFKVIIVLLGMLLLIRFTFNKSINTILAGFGIVGAAIALSARESLENLIASFIIFFDKPFSHGDLVKVQQITGTVERIGLRSTRIRTDMKTYVTVPNKQMVDSILDNLSLRTQRKVNITLEISSATSHDMLNQLIFRIDNILLKRKDYIQTYSVVLADITKNNFIIQVEYFTGAIAIDIYNDVRQEVNLSIIKTMEEMKVKLAGKEGELVFS